LTIETTGIISAAFCSFIDPHLLSLAPSSKEVNLRMKITDVVATIPAISITKMG